MSATMRLRPADLADAQAINDIYNHYVLHSTCTFQEEPETLAARQAWLAKHDAPHVVLVAEEPDGSVIGWAALSPFHPRSAYRFTVEDSVYLRPDRLGQGLGRLLLGELMSAARAGGFRNVIAHICCEQTASLALHRKAGFRDTTELRQVGYKFGRWLDTVMLQAQLTA